MFTFATLTYNHERYIIEHLESIKYQIEVYGQNEKFNLIICDDYSTDNTIELVELWRELNLDLFNEFLVLRSSYNQGIVQNYLKATENIKTAAYKLLAGDDLYYNNNIFDVISEIDRYDVYFTPIISFDDDVVFKSNEFYFALVYNTYRRIRIMLNYRNIFNAPGAFLNSRIALDKDLRSCISKYKWIEDLPTWHYLFYYRENLVYGISKKPYILYRSSHGISTSTLNNKNSAFEIERLQMFKDLNMTLYTNSSKFNPHRLIWKLINIKMKLFDLKFNSSIIEYDNLYIIEMKRASDFIKYLKHKTSQFYESTNYRF
jgi:hypothetical protein